MGFLETEAGKENKVDQPLRTRTSDLSFPNSALATLLLVHLAVPVQEEMMAPLEMTELPGMTANLEIRDLEDPLAILDVPENLDPRVAPVPPVNFAQHLQLPLADLVSLAALDLRVLLVDLAILALMVSLETLERPATEAHPANLVAMVTQVDKEKQAAPALEAAAITAHQLVWLRDTKPALFAAQRKLSLGLFFVFLYFNK